MPANIFISSHQDLDELAKEISKFYVSKVNEID